MSYLRCAWSVLTTQVRWVLELRDDMDRCPHCERVCGKGGQH